MGDVVHLDVETTVPIDPETVLDGASGANLDACMVIGWDADGKLYLASSDAELGGLLLLLELAKQEILDRALD